MKDKKPLKKKNSGFEKKDPVAEHVIATDCDASCKNCAIYKQKTEEPSLSYCALLQKTISETNILLFKALGIIIIGFLTSVINFSRLAAFDVKQLYLETVLLTGTYYIIMRDIFGAAALLVGGLFHWFLAFRSKNKILTSMMTTLTTLFAFQVKSNSLVYYELFMMMEHMAMSCIVVYFTPVLTIHYVKVVIYCLCFAYLTNALNSGVYVEDFFLLIIILSASGFTVSGDLQHCCVPQNLSLLIIWITMREIRAKTSYNSFGFKFFN